MRLEQLDGDVEQPVFTSFAYATIAPRKTSLEPGTSVSRLATCPPVHDSAVTSESPRRRSRSSTSAGVETSSRLNR